MVVETQDFQDIKQKYAHVVEEEEDSKFTFILNNNIHWLRFFLFKNHKIDDGHGKHDDKEPESTIVSAATQIANTIMGAGILNLPLVMRCLGLPLGVLFIILIAIITIYSVYILLECSENSDRK